MHRAFILFTLGLGLAACASDTGDEGIFLSKNVSPGDGCIFSATQAELFNPHGSFSLFARRGYDLFPQMISKITSREDNVEQRTIQVRGARVDLAMADGSAVNAPTHFESLFAAPLAPNGGISDAAFELVPVAFAAAVATANNITPATTTVFKAEVVAKVVLFGDLTGNEVTSQEFQYPVTLCNDCVTNIIGTCPLPSATVLANVGNPCNAYQDGYVDCCISGNNVICPGTIAPM
jgi:hypothetical protein